MPRHAGIHRLTTKQCEAGKGPTVLEDGGGLRLVIAASGARRWIMRATVAGKRRDLGLGSFAVVDLKTARSRATTLRRIIEAGEPLPAAGRYPRARRLKVRDVLAPTSAAASDQLTVAEVFREFWRLKRQQLGNAKYARLWCNSLDTYAFPSLGRRPITDVTTREVATVLEPIWRSKPETASHVKIRLKMIFDFAIASGYREAGNPVLPVKMILGEQGHRTTHHRALPHSDTSAFVAALRQRRGDGASRLALEWLVLTATRSAETRLARFDEIDVAAATWTVPIDRMKAKREHVVPLSTRCLEIVAECRRLWPNSPLLFPSGQGKQPHLSENTFQRTLDLMGLGERATAHGMRSTFRDWAAEEAKARHDVAEACLAHKLKDATVAAYLRTSFLAERRQLMQAWADYVCSPPR